MKKTLALFILLGFLASCGPHRMKCGPGRRCSVEPPINKAMFYENIA